MGKTGIEYVDRTWNPLTGCSKVSPGCKFCYAERWALDLQRAGEARYRNGFELTLHPDKLDLPLRRRIPTRYFVNSMSDMYHEDCPADFIKNTFDVILRAPWHEFLILTKRSERLVKLAPELPWPPNIWQGVSIENAEYLWRINDLLKVPAVVHWLSLEPLLGPLPNLPLTGIEWVVVGGESGEQEQRRRMDPGWVQEIRDQCLAADVPFNFKQWGGRTSKSGGRTLDGRTWDEYPRGKS